MMEKYGVSDTEELQRKELESIRARLKVLRSSHEKTSAETTEVERLEAREAELDVALSSQSSRA